MQKNVICILNCAPFHSTVSWAAILILYLSKFAHRLRIHCDKDNKQRPFIIMQSTNNIRNLKCVSK